MKLDDCPLRTKVRLRNPCVSVTGITEEWFVQEGLFENVEGAQICAVQARGWERSDRPAIASDA